MRCVLLNRQNLKLGMAGWWNWATTDSGLCLYAIWGNLAGTMATFLITVWEDSRTPEQTSG